MVEHTLGKGEVGGSIPPCGILCDKDAMDARCIVE